MENEDPGIADEVPLSSDPRPLSREAYTKKRNGKADMRIGPGENEDIGGDLE